MMDRGTSYDGWGTLYDGYLFSTNSLYLWFLIAQELKNLNSIGAVKLFFQYLILSPTDPPKNCLHQFANLGMSSVRPRLKMWCFWIGRLMVAIFWGPKHFQESVSGKFKTWWGQHQIFWNDPKHCTPTELFMLFSFGWLGVHHMMDGVHYMMDRTSPRDLFGSKDALLPHY